MFNKNLELISVDLSNFDCSQVVTMAAMFDGCINLKSINLKNIITSSVVLIDRMFQNCRTLKYLDLSSFDTSSVTNMRSLFNNCTSLVSLDISSFNTMKVENMDCMFYNDESLISLDLSNFDISSLVSMKQTFYGCKSLVYINMKSFIEKTYVTANNLFSNELNDLTYCINETKSSKIFSSIHNINLNNNCDDICFSDSKKIIIKKKKCVDKCNSDDTYIYEYNGICYENNDFTDKISGNEKTENTKEIEGSENTDKIENTNENNDKIENQNTEKNDDGYSEKTDKDNTVKIENENTEKNENENTERTDIKNNEKTEIFDDKEITDFNEILKVIMSENNYKESLDINYEDFPKKDELIKSIKQYLKTGKLDSLLLKLMSKEKNDLLAHDKNIIYQITTTENQKENNYTNISTISLGDCEDILKKIYGINPKIPLIIFKIDYYIPGLLIPVIGYEIYHPIDKYQLDLNYCKDILFKLKIPVSIDENNLFKYDPNNEYYTDECYPYTTENGTDILINDRQNEYIDNNLSLCENNCSYNGYDKNTKKVLCICETKHKIDLISEIMSNEFILSNNFSITDNTSSNIITMKCTKTLFSKDGLIINIGSYLLLFSFVFLIISVNLFYKCGYQLIENSIEEIIV